MNSQIAIINFKKRNYKEEIEWCDALFNSTEYTYQTDLTDLKRGDIVIVETRYGIEIAQFLRYEPISNLNEFELKWIITRIDLKEHKERLKKLRDKEILLEKMRKLRDSSMELELFSNLAKLNPQMAELLDQYNKL